MAEKTLTRPSLKKQAPVASKSTMNLAFHESSFRLSRVLPVILVVVIIAALFAKFGFIDMISKKTAAYAELGQKQEQMQSISAKLAEYDELAAEYGRYSYGWLTEDEAALVDRMAVLAIIEKTIATSTSHHGMMETAPPLPKLNPSVARRFATSGTLFNR